MEVMKPTAVILSIAMVGFEKAHVETRKFEPEPRPTMPFNQMYTASGVLPVLLNRAIIDFR